MSRRPTYAQIAADFRLWQEYADPNGTMDQPAFDETPMDERLGLLKQAFGPELPALEPGFYGVTELHRATWDGDVGQVRQLLAQGMHVDAADLDGDTPLLAAARNGHERLLDVLLEAGADPFLENHEGESPSQYLIVQSRVVDPVHQAVAAGDTATLADLINNGANLRRFDKNGNTPAHAALAHAYRYDLGMDRIDVDTKQRAVLDMLLRADPDLVDVPNGQHRETIQSQVDAMDLAGCPSPPLAAANPQEAMWVALFKGDAAELADVLNRCHADVNQRTSDGATPLHVAAKNGRAAQVKTLLAHQADPTVAWCGMTPLYVATSAGHANTMGVLLNAGSDPLAAPAGGCALHVAAERRDPAALALLLDNGLATVDPRDESTGQTPLHVAARRGNGEACRLLVANGASLDVADHLGRTALDHAKGDAAVLDAITLGQTDRQTLAGAPVGPVAAIASPSPSGGGSDAELDALRARVAELEAANAGLLADRQQLKDALRDVLASAKPAPSPSSRNLGGPQ